MAMADSLNLLLIEDVEDDALLVLRELRRGGFHPVWQRVETLEELRLALGQKQWDIVISDYRLPKFNAPNALKAVREHNPSIPFILVSGTIREVLAVEMMKAGAHDYVMKDNLKRLPEAVRRELRDAQFRFEHQQAELLLKESEQRFRTLFESTPMIAVQGYDRHRQVIYWNDASERLYGYSKAEVLGKKLEDLIIPPEMCSTVIDAVNHWLNTGESIPAGELNLLRKDGSLVPVYSSHIMLTNAEGEPEMYCVDLDLSDQQSALRERQQTELELRESEERYRLLAENTNDLVCLHEPDGRYIYVSPSCEMLLGYHYKELVGRYPHDFFHPDDYELIRESHNHTLNQQPLPVTYRIRHKSGNYVWFETLSKPIKDANDQIIKLQTTSRNITERIEAQQRLRYDALHDGLTGLPNRSLLTERLELAINRSRRFESYQYAVLFLDLDRFKVINDSLGHLVGDHLLTLVAQKLQEHIRDIDLVARLGGDEFVILLEDVTGIEKAIQVTERILEDLQSPLYINETEVVISTSVGIVLGTQSYHQPSTLIRDADIAMYRAKAEGRGSYKVFDVEMHTQAVNRLTLETDLRKALERGEFFIYYQPIFDIVNFDNRQKCTELGINPASETCLVGFEALVRWQHPIRGIVNPEKFIPIAEETGLIVPIDQWVFQMVCQQLAKWQKQFPNFVLKMSINLSAQDLSQSNLLAEIDRVLAVTKISGAAITLEITESMLIENISKTIRLLRQLKERQIQISIDDFGTGYSSLNYLHRLPADNLKIDRSFVGQMQQGNRNYQVVSTIIALSNQLGLAVVAEGIETKQQLQWLRELGCEFGQGYLFSEPMNCKMVETILGNQLSAIGH
jgi:diguanylate cyclase (GGDEF)-like protein/PAS domain S-box-containing protein